MIGLLKRYFSVFFEEEYSYTIGKPVDEVLREVRELITTKRPFLNVPNISGRMDRYTFEASPAWSLLVIEGGTDRANARISGRLVEVGPTAASIDMTVSPNWVFLLFYIAFNILGVILCIGSGATHELIAGGLLFILIAHVVPWAGAYFSKKFLRETFEEALGITPQT